MGAIVMDFIQTDSTGRVCAWTFDAKYAIGFEQVELPEGFEVGRMTDWLYRDGEWTHDPLPEPETEIDRLTAVEMQLAALCGEPRGGV